MDIRARAIAGELRWMMDPTDPLAPYNRLLARTFLRTSPRSILAGGRLIPTEGHTVKSQAQFIHRLMQRQTAIRTVAEIGFNAGHSSYLFLSSRPDVRVVSFDLAEHDYVDLAKGLVDRRFPGRHELVKGSSLQTVPAFAEAHPHQRFDLLFVDGGHDYEVAAADLANCASLSGGRSLVMMDDVEPAHEWGSGPAKAWTDAVASGLVDQLFLVEDGFTLVDASVDDLRSDATVWALGRYRRGASSHAAATAAAASTASTAAGTDAAHPLAPG